MRLRNRHEKSIILFEAPEEEIPKTPSWFARHWFALVLGALILSALTVLAVLMLRNYLTTPETLLDKGRALYYDGHYTDAVDKLREYIIENPDDSEARQLVAQGLTTLLQTQPAEGYLRDLLSAKPNDPAALFWMGKALVVDKKYDQAEQYWQNLLGTPDQNYRARVFLNMADLRFQQSRFDEANRYLGEALKLGGPFDPLEAHRASYLSGLFLLRDTRFDAARDQFKRTVGIKADGKWQNNGPVQWTISQLNDRIRAITATLPGDDPNESEAARRTKAGYALLNGDELGLAEEQIVRVLQLTPGFIDAQAYLGSIYWRTGRVEQAQKYLYLVLKADPNNRFARQVLVQLATDQLQRAQPVLNSPDSIKQARDFATDLLQKLIKERPDDPLLQVDLARLYISQANYDDAQNAYFKALDLNTRKPVPGLNIDNLLLQLYTEIGVDPCGRGGMFAERAIKEYPDDPESWYWSGLSNLLCSKFNLAITQFQKALELRPYWPLATYRLGLAFYEKGDIETSKMYLDMATDLDPSARWIRRD